MSKLLSALAAAAALLLAAAPAAHGQGSGAQPAPPPRFPGQAQFRDLYKELIEIDTTAEHGSCRRAAEAMAARLKAGGYPDADVQVLSPADRPKDANLVAVLHGSDARA